MARRIKLDVSPVATGCAFGVSPVPQSTKERCDRRGVLEVFSFEGGDSFDTSDHLVT